MTATAVLPHPRRSSEPRSAATYPGSRSASVAAPVGQHSRAVDSQRVLHQLVRRELRLLAEVASWTAADDAGHAAALARHAELVARVLLHHHAVERDRLWPALRRSVGRDDASAADAADVDAALDGWITDCSRIDALLRDVGTAARQWAVATTRPARDAFASACRHLADVVQAQTAEEERVLLPLLARHLDPADWQAIARSACAGLSVRERSMLLGLALEDACAGDRVRLLAGLPVTSRTAWRLVGHSRYRAAVVRLRGEPPAV